MIPQWVSKQIDRAPRWFWLLLILFMATAAISGSYRQTAGFDLGSAFDGTVLKLEFPRNSSELTAIVAPKDARWWMTAEYWGFLMIPAYLLLFAVLLLPDQSLVHWTWESPLLYIFVTAVCDCFSKVALLICLSNIEHFRNPGPRSFLVLQVFGGLKWLFTFLACRTLAIQYSRYRRWIGAGVLLRAFAIGGAWATVLVLIGLPTRPIIALSILATIIVIGAALVLGWTNWSAGPRLHTAGDGSQVDVDARSAGAAAS